MDGEPGLLDALAGATRVAVVGVGQELEGDDGAGMAVARLFRRLWRGKGAAPGRVRRPVATTILAGVAPENATLALRRFHPTHTLFIDAADLGLPPGQWRVIGLEEIGGVTFSTHMLPLPMLARFIGADLGCRVVVVGIQPQRLTYGEGLTAPVKRGAAELAAALADTLRQASAGRRTGQAERTEPAERATK